MSTRSQGAPQVPYGAAEGRRYPLAPARPRPALAVGSRLTLETVASRSGLHPDLVRRFVALSLLEATRDDRGDLWFPPRTLATIARIQRLRASLCLNYAAMGLVLDLLDRIEELEAAARAGASAMAAPPGGPAPRDRPPTVR
ncbi:MULTISPECIES: chaperone modulator CbpM [unclassified Pseudofrankia]|uniref:chaperone modulator CbpM n=1 Tax=unclassified Pseudofrankia TaxID=2994372 RepID=UPI0009F71F7D|nr:MULTISPECIES: chaperone modulator CbpM [unclassified Pseudofrankia]MDT3445354.1 chaperone modulator CbpM [Pseudofrankia sp. BMG5.37]